MMHDCWRCGWGGRVEESGCPLCKPLDDKQAAYVKNLHGLELTLYRLTRREYAQEA